MSSIQHAAWPDPGRNRSHTCLARPQWEGMVGAKGGRVGAAARGGARGVRMRVAHLRMGVGGRGRRPMV
jgi:hypothetical protein